MQYLDVHLENFRNYKDKTFSFHEKVNLFIGENARGKTNLLESLYVTSYGKSFRTIKDKEMIGFGEEYCRIRGTFKRELTGDDENKIEIYLGSDGTRKGNVNGIPFEKFSDIFDNVLAVIFSPEDLKIVKESPDRRRDFIDRELGRLSLSYYRDLMMYRRALAQRNAYLKEDFRDARMLMIWDENLVKYGARIIMKRREFIEKLDRICKKIHGELTGSKESIQIVYDPDIPFNEEDDRAAIEESFRETFTNSSETDFRLRYTSRGPQKDDIDVIVNGISVRTFGSQGQQRTAALSMKLSEVELIREEKGEYPILLLDDVLSELDTSRQSFLINSLEDVQMFITATDISPVVRDNLPDAKVIRI